MIEWSIEDFQPKIKKGVITPAGRNFVYASGDLKSKELPLAVVDLVLLCDGKNTVFQILAKIYEKQGVVQFQKVVETFDSLLEDQLFESSPELESFEKGLHKILKKNSSHSKTFSEYLKILPFFGSGKELFTRDSIRQKLENLSFFSEFSDEGMEEILDACEVIVFARNQVIINKDENPKDLFLLLEGQCEALGEGFRGGIQRGSFFGEAALLSSGSRSATVKTLSPCKVLRIPTDRVRKNVVSEKQLDVLRQQIIVSQYFGSSPHFEGVKENTIERLQRTGQLELKGSGAVIFDDGDPTSGLYFLVRGSVRVDIAGEKVVDLHQGDVFGEISVLAKLPRTARVSTTEPSFLFKVSLESFWEVLLTDLEFAYRIERLCEVRLADDFEILSKKSQESA
ncbi:MAG: hypothetical protein CL676_13555 [Bdellovibrionaceae bacterium]|nr:hypothetical protein [Pseudobdellovibrionaceae bacterium]|tara:strand:+ start:359 stop:1549 length:1191 start_codon:yes stop_codon:yes gene_type:complete